MCDSHGRVTVNGRVTVKLELGGQMGNGHFILKGHFKVYFQSYNFILTLLTP